MLFRGRGVMGAPLKGGEQSRPIAFFDDTATSNASEVRVIGLRRVEVTEKIVPFENLIFAATRTRHIRMFLAAVQEVARDATAGRRQRRADLENFRVGDGA